MHGIDLKKIKRAIQKTADVSEEKLNNLLDDVVERNRRYYNDLITLADVTKPDRLVDASDIDAIRRQTLGELDRKSTRLNSSHKVQSRMPSSA